MVATDRSGKYSQAHDGARRQHAPRARNVGIVAIGIRDVQRTDGGDERLRNMTQGDAGNQRQGKAQRVAQGNPRRDLFLLELKDPPPETHLGGCGGGGGCTGCSLVLSSGSGGTS